MKYEGGWDKSPSLIFSLDCGARCSGCVASTTLIPSAFTVLLNCWRWDDEIEFLRITDFCPTLPFIFY